MRSEVCLYVNFFYLALHPFFAFMFTIKTMLQRLDFDWNFVEKSSRDAVQGYKESRLFRCI